MKLFDNRVQETKYKVLREVAYQTWKGNDVFAEFNEIANNVIPKDEPPQTCCIYKDRAVVAERVRHVMNVRKPGMWLQTYAEDVWLTVVFNHAKETLS